MFSYGQGGNFPINTVYQTHTHLFPFLLSDKKRLEGKVTSTNVKTTRDRQTPQRYQQYFVDFFPTKLWKMENTNNVKLFESSRQSLSHIGKCLSQKQADSWCRTPKWLKHWQHQKLRKTRVSHAAKTRRTDGRLRSSYTVPRSFPLTVLHPERQAISSPPHRQKIRTLLLAETESEKP